MQTKLIPSECRTRITLKLGSGRVVDRISSDNPMIWALSLILSCSSPVHLGLSFTLCLNLASQSQFTDDQLSDLYGKKDWNHNFCSGHLKSNPRSDEQPIAFNQLIE